MNKYGLKLTLSNEEYHQANGFLSSSMLKLMVQSPELYYLTYIAKTAEREENPAFDLGTAIHMRILEPELYAINVIFFSGIKRGKVWDEFKSKNPGKLILGDLQKVQLDRMYNSFLNSGLGPSLISNGYAEVSLFTRLEDRDIKVRADYINVVEGKIFDLKSTSGIISEEKFRQNAESRIYGYDIQAALYVDAYTQDAKADQDFEFYWIVMSKDFDDIKFFRASPELIAQGRTKYKLALSMLKASEIAGWEFKNLVIDIYPSRLFQEDL